MNIKVLNLVSRTNETRHIKRHETFKCKCRQDASVCNSKQRWNKDKSRCECKELIDKGICDRGFIWNPSNYEYDKLLDVGEYLDYVNCQCRKRLVDKLIIGITLFELKNKCKSSFTIYVVLIANIFTICIGIGTYYVYYKYMNHSKKTALKYDYVYKA